MLKMSEMLMAIYLVYSTSGILGREVGPSGDSPNRRSR